MGKRGDATVDSSNASHSTVGSDATFHAPAIVAGNTRWRPRRASVSGITGEQRENHALGALPLSPNKQGGHLEQNHAYEQGERAAMIEALSPTRKAGKVAISNGFQAPPEMRSELSECVSGLLTPLPDKRPTDGEKQGLPSLGQLKNIGFKPKCKLEGLDIPENSGWEVRSKVANNDKKGNNATARGTQMRACEIVSAARTQLK